MRKKLNKRILSLALSGVMILSSCPQALAVTAAGDHPAEAEQEQQEMETATPSNAQKNDADTVPGGAGPVETVTENKAEGVQEMINALPEADEITLDNVDEIAGQLQDILDAMDELSDEEAATLDLTRYEKAAEAVETLNKPAVTIDEPETYNGPSVVLGTEHLQNGSDIYMGYIKSDLVDVPDWSKLEWRVLDNESNERLFLFAENADLFAPLPFDDNNNSNWTESSAQKYLQSIVETRDYFSETERSLIEPQLHTDKYGSGESNDLLFLLSKEEVEDERYFPLGDASRASNADYWLRTPGRWDVHTAYSVNVGGTVSQATQEVSTKQSLRPAMKINLEPVLFTMDTDMPVGDNAFTSLPSMSKVRDQKVSSWRLVLKEEDASGFQAELADPAGEAKAGGTVKVNYTGAFPEDYLYDGRYVSAILADQDGKVLYYGQIARYDSNMNQGQVEIPVPKDVEPGNYTLKVFHERFVPNTYVLKASSYASDFQDLDITVTEGDVDPQPEPTPQIQAPANVAWDESSVAKAVWDAVEGAVAYEVQLYTVNADGQLVKNRNPIRVENKTEQSFPLNDFEPEYVFGVKAIGSDGTMGEEARSEAKRFTSIQTKEFTVRFYSGLKPGYDEQQTVKAGEKLVEPEKPVRDGYIFSGWKTEDGAVWDFNNPVTKDMSLNAQWTMIIDAPEDFEYHTGETGLIRWSAVNGASGYILQLYGVDKDGNYHNMGDPVKVDANTTTYRFNITDTSYRYVFGIRAVNANGQAGPEGHSITITYLPTPANLEWNRNIVGKAKWEAVEGAAGYYVQLYSDDGAGGRTPVGKGVNVNGKDSTSYTFNIDSTLHSYSFGVRAFPATGTENTGYSLEGYSGAKTFSRVNTSYVDVKFDANGGVPSPLATLTIRVGRKITDVGKPHEPTKDGYILMGWIVAETGQQWNMNTPVTSAMTLVAVWGKESSVGTIPLLEVSINGTKGTISPAYVTIKLPRGSKIPTDPSAIKITLRDSVNHVVTDLNTADNGKTWTFKVKSKDGTVISNYTMKVSVLSSGGGSGSGGGGGGGSSSGGGGGSSSGGSRRNTSSTVNQTTMALPAYVVRGSWSQPAANQWRFTDGSGVLYKSRWAAVENPYANTAAGQSSFDWFRFNENGDMMTGWFRDFDSNWYYLNPLSDGTRGKMVTGWKWLTDADGVQRCYYFNPLSDGTRGKMMTNTTIDGSTIDADGHWTVNGVVQTK